jgi:hypothetical protein
MKYTDNQFINSEFIYWDDILRRDITKSGKPLQPIFEAFTNAIEAIKDAQKVHLQNQGEITIKINSTESTITDQFIFSSLSITDNGIGFNDEQFNRFNSYRNISKGYKNLGSGRIQYVHYFDSTIIKSVFEQNNNFYEREFVISKKEPFIKNNAIVKHIFCKESTNKKSGTTILFNALLENIAVYNELNEKNLKEKLIERYFQYLCYNRNKLPKIKIEFYVQSKLIGKETISKLDIPNTDKTDLVKINYFKKSSNGDLELTNKKEDFVIDAFMIPKNTLKQNELKLVSKGEVVEESYLSLENLSKNDNIKGNKYLFLVSSNYIDSNDSHIRGILNIPNRESYAKNLFSNNEVIFLEDIQENVNNKIKELYPEIEKVKQKHQDEFQKLKEMFLLDETIIGENKITINDSESKILEKFYEAEAKKTATLDATIKEKMDNLNSLNTNSPDYSEMLNNQVKELLKKIPLQNKSSLSHYVARRKLVLELFQKILDKEIENLKNGGRIDEDIMHNLIFQQSSSGSENSDLWLIAEEFIYFKGFSENKLKNIELNGKKIFKDKFTEEEERYLKSLGEDRLTKRPDVLLFPEEGKCIIIEFKAPDVNVSEHLSQIDFYANLIRNYTVDEFQITSFYGYLIGESIEDRDVRGRVSRFEHSYHLGYWFRPSEKVIGYDDREGKDGNLYTEVIKFSTLLQRAKLRNKIFITKLGLSKIDINQV